MKSMAYWKLLILTLGASIGGCSDTAAPAAENASVPAPHDQDPEADAGGGRSRSSNATSDGPDASLEESADTVSELTVDKAFWFEGWRVLLHKAIHRDLGTHEEVVFEAEFKKLFGSGLSDFGDGWDDREMLLISSETYQEVDTSSSSYPSLPYGTPGEGTDPRSSPRATGSACASV